MAACGSLRNWVCLIRSGQPFFQKALAGTTAVAGIVGMYLPSFQMTSKSHGTFLYKVKRGMLIASSVLILLFVLHCRTPILFHMAMGLAKGLSFLTASSSQLAGSRSGWIELLRKCFNRGTDGDM